MTSKNPLENPIYFGANADTLQKASELRKNMTNSEKLLWEKIRNKQLNGYKFRRQHTISNFIADFYCHRVKLVIEIDGGYHNNEEQKEYDIGRTVELNELGITVIRFTNSEVENEIEKVIEAIKKYLE